MRLRGLLRVCQRILNLDADVLIMPNCPNPFAEVPEAADPGLDPGQELELREADRRVAAAIAALPERQREAILLTYEEGLSNAETAAVLGTSVSGVETLLLRARRALRQTLGIVPDSDT